MGQVSGRASVCSGLRPVGMNLLVGVRGFDRSESLALKYVVSCCNLPVVWGGLAAGCSYLGDETYGTLKFKVRELRRP